MNELYVVKTHTPYKEHNIGNLVSSIQEQHQSFSLPFIALSDKYVSRILGNNNWILDSRPDDPTELSDLLQKRLADFPTIVEHIGKRDHSAMYQRLQKKYNIHVINVK